MPAVRARACAESLDLALAAWLPDVEHGDPGLRHRHRHRLAGRGRADRRRLVLAVLLRARLLGFVLRDLRLRNRQWQLARRRGEIELARDEHRESAAMLDAAGNPAGLVPGAEIEIGARRADDRRAGVLRDRQAADRRIRLRALDRQVALDEERRAVFVHAVDRDGAAGRQWHALRADRLAVVGEAGDAEEHVGAVGGTRLRGFLRIRRRPRADALLREILARDQIALGQHALDRAVGVTVVRIVADAQRRAVLEDHARRALDLDRDQVERILDPADLELLAVECAGLDGAAVVIRHEIVVLGAAADAPALVRKRGRTLLVALGDQVARPAINRHRKFRTGKARAGDDRFVITGHQTLALAQAGDAHGLKVLLEEGARGSGILRLERERLAADIRQGAEDQSALVAARLSARGAAAGLVGGEGGEMIVGRPARELAPFERLELAAGGFQRILLR